MPKDTIQLASRKNKATMENFKVLRDGEGKLVPLDWDITIDGEILQVEVLPMTYGDAEVWGETMGDADKINSNMIAKQFAKHIVSPDMSDLKGNDLNKDYKPLVIQELLMAIIGASGLGDQLKAKVNSDGTATIEVDDTKNE